MRLSEKEPRNPGQYSCLFAWGSSTNQSTALADREGWTGWC